MVKKLSFYFILFFFAAIRQGWCKLPFHNKFGRSHFFNGEFIIVSDKIDPGFSRYLIRLKNKNGTPFLLSNPSSYLSQRAIDRRSRYGITIDSTDLPVNPAYVEQISNVPNVTILNISKWLNAVTIQTGDVNALAAINALPFVQSATAIAARLGKADNPSKLEKNDAGLRIAQTAGVKAVLANYYNYGTASFNEIHLHNGEFLHNIGLRGKGMEISLLDNGFNNYSAAAFHAFDSVNANHQVLGTWDFVAREQDVTNDGNHGMSCFSIIAANIPGQFIGKAPEANFWLFQTEDNSSEYPIEEVNWSCGAERADSSGADVISSSLGYAIFDSARLDHTYSDMDGNTTIAATAADLAAKKGILVFIANGNSGNDAWHFLSTPADGDSVIAVGAVDAAGNIASFSSYGPSADGRVKPDVASVGVSAVLENSVGSVSTGNGTSFATPNIAGLGACLWQGFPELNNIQVRRALWQSGSANSTPNDRIGYGIPDMKLAFIALLKMFASGNASASSCKTTINWTSKDVSDMSYSIERKIPGESDYTNIVDVPATLNEAVLATHSYHYDDTLINVQSGTISYRIRQVIDPTASIATDAYLDTIDVVLGNSCITTGVNSLDPGGNMLKIIPNPSPGRFALQIQTFYPIKDLDIVVTDMEGRKLLRMRESKSTGMATFEIPVQSLSSGKYIVSVYNGRTLLASKKIIRL